MDRVEIKAKAREAIAAQRGNTILAVLLYMAVVGLGSVFGAIPFLGFLLVWGTVFFIDYPLFVNLSGYFMKIFSREYNDAGEVEIGQIFSGLFNDGYLRKVGGMAWMFLFTSLWTLLFIVPGIIKGISYSMTPLILSTYPNVGAQNALKLSMRMTQGHKEELFVTMLSFIGWFILSGLTFGVLWVLYVGPYVYATYAGYFVKLRDKALAEGVIDKSELGLPAATGESFSNL